MWNKYFLLFGILFIINQSFSQTLFVNQASDLNLDISAGDTYLGNGITFCDVDNDGWDDITIATSAGSNIKFFKNINGSFSLQELNIPTNTAEIKDISWVDFDNDGDKDLYLTSAFSGNKLYLNTGSMMFQEITAISGLPISNVSTYGTSWGDYNNDGYLDAFISNRGEFADEQNYLFKNNGDTTFSDVTELAGIDDLSHLSFCSVFFDFNNDGWQDIYVSNDKYFSANLLYKNNGDNTFTDVSVISGTNVSIDAMSTTIGDFNNDGWQDIYVTNTEAGNVLLKNNGDETFTDIAGSSGTLFNSIGWGAVFLDADNDMDLDLYVSSMVDGSNPNYISAAFYDNLNNETYIIPSNAGFVGDTGRSFCNAIGDVDNDGYPDIVVSNGNNENIHFWKNETNPDNNWLKVKLEGTQSNRDGIGSVIEISVDNKKQYRYTLCGEGYLSQNSSTEFFGLGPNTIIEYVKVTWLSGIEDVIFNASPNQLLYIVEGSFPLSIDDTGLQEVNIYPNPFKDQIEISSNAKIEHISVYNIVGQKIMNIINIQNHHIQSIDTSGLQSGAYFVKATVDGVTATRHIVKK